MIVSQIRTEIDAGHATLHAVVRCDTEWVNEGEPFEFWMRFPATCAQDLRADNGDPLVAAFLAPAMVLGESLEIDAPVSPRLLSRLPEIQVILRSWDRHLQEVTVVAPERSEPPPLGENQAVGLFFSLGVDSSYSLLKNVTAHPDDDETVSELIVIEGCDMYLWESARFPPLHRRIEHVAEAMGKGVVHVTTNLRNFSDQLADWVRIYYGAALASTALALGRRFSRVHIAAAQTYARLVPGGAHPLLDPLWGTETLSFIHDGLEADRLEKIRFIGHSRLLVENLRVCTADGETDIYNCGECEKCLRTMIGLKIAGVLEQCASLPHKIDPELVRRCSVKNAVAREYMRSLADALGTSREDAEIKAALEECLQRNEA